MTNTAFQQTSRNRMPPARGQRMPNNMSGAPPMANGGKMPSWMERSRQMMADGGESPDSQSYLQRQADAAWQRQTSGAGPGKGGSQYSDHDTLQSLANIAAPITEGPMTHGPGKAPSSFTTSYKPAPVSITKTTIVAQPVAQPAQRQNPARNQSPPSATMARGAVSAPANNLITPASGFQSDNRPIPGTPLQNIQPTYWATHEAERPDDDDDSTPHMANGGYGEPHGTVRGYSDRNEHIGGVRRPMGDRQGMAPHMADGGRPAPVAGDTAPYRVRRTPKLEEPDTPEAGSELGIRKARRYFGQMEGDAPRRADAPAKMMADGGKWASEAFGHNKGGLHRALGVPEGKTIPEAKKVAATHSKNAHLRHMAQAAVNI